MAMIRNDLVCDGSLVEPTSAALNGYLWVADPRQVAFSCAAKRKPPKRRPPRSACRLRRVPSVPRPSGRSQTRRALMKRASGSNSARLEAPARAAVLGTHYGDPKPQTNPKADTAIAL